VVCRKCIDSLCGAFAVCDISGGPFNPAVAVGGTMMGLMSQ
jgi:glycerol uptake facilitator-like aquaporin